MRRLYVLVVVALMLAGSAAAAEDAKKESAAASPTSAVSKKIVVFDGDKIGDGAKGWATAGAIVAAQDKEVRTPGKKVVQFHAEGTGYLGCGWNWFGWWPQDGGTDAAGSKNLHFWAKLTGDAKPTLLSASLVSSDSGKKTGETCNLLKYCAKLTDGAWHEIVIPIQDLDPKNALNRNKVWELMLGSWSQDKVSYTLFVDEVGFQGQGDSSSRTSAGTATSASNGAASNGAAAAPDVAAAPLPNVVAANDPNVRYIGRWDLSNPAAPRASWTYSLVTAKFKGTAISAALHGSGFYQVVVDGKPTKVIEVKSDRDVYSLANNLPNSEHRVEIVRRTEGAWIAPLTFLGFQLEKGATLLPLPPRSERRILIVGDSISCGYGSEAIKEEHNPPAKENGYMTYGGIAARALDAEVQIVAWSGRKMYPDNTMVEVYDRTLAMDAQPKADLKGWVPGVVVIDLGTNDFGNKAKQPDEKGWIDAYEGFIKTVRQTAPQAYVFVASGPMGTSHDWDAWAKTIVADLNRAGDKKVSYLPFPSQDVNGDGVGGDWHPNLKTHAKMAELLVREIQNAVGWK